MKARQAIAAFLCGTILTAFAAMPRSGFSSTKELAAAPSAPTAPTAVQGCPDRGQSIMLITVFAVQSGQVDSLGMMAADSVRDQVARRMCRDFFPRPKGDMEHVLRQSDFPTTKALPTSDIKLLASTLSADIVVYGQVSVPRTNDWTITPRLMDPTDAWIQEPLAPAKNTRIRQVAIEAMERVREAARIVPEYRKCRGAWNSGKFDEAVTAANAALALFPQSLMARVCLGMALEGSKASPDTVLAIAKQILAVNPRDYHGIRLREGAERAKGNKDTANALLIDLLTLDPLNIPLQERVITEFAGAQDYDQALKVAEAAKAANPGNTDILSLYATICYAVQKWECAISALDEIAQMGDTTAQNVTYFKRLSSAHQKSGNPRQAANIVARGASKFADTVELHIFHGQFLREAGDTSASIAALRKALSLDPSKIEVHQQIIAAQAGNVDSLLVSLGAALPHAKTAQDSAVFAQQALAPGQTLFNSTLETIRDSTKATDEEFDKFDVVIRLMEFAEKATPASAAGQGANLPRFYGAVANFQIGFRALKTAFASQAADPVKTCQAATNAYDRMTKARDVMMAGAITVHRDTGAGIIQATNDNQSLLAELKTKFCKPGG